MELIKEKVTIGEIVFSDDFEIMSDSDLIVPDVKPDIMKVLGVEAVSYVSEKSITDGRVSLRGKTDFTVLYMPEDGEGGICVIRTAAEFSHRIENPKINEGDKAKIKAEIGKTDFHVINSRKIGLRAVTQIDCEIISERNIELASETSEQMQTCADMIELNTLLGVHDEEFLIKDSLEIPHGKPSIEEIYKVDYKICDVEMKSMTEKLVIRGMLNVCVLYGNGGAAEYTEAELPFTEVFDFPDLYEDDVCDLNLRICNANWEVETDSDGDLRIVASELTVCAEMSAERKETFTVLKDCFLPGNRTKLTYAENEIMIETAHVCTQNTLRDAATIPQNAPNIKSVCRIESNAIVTKTEIVGGKTAVGGYAKCFVQYISDDESSPIVGFCKDIPFECLLDAGGAELNAQINAEATVTHVSYHLNVAGEVEIRCVLSVCVRLFERKKLKLISDIENEEIPKESRKGIVIYFVQPGDTMWDIAKEYCVSPEDIAEFNSLTVSDDLAVGGRLIIPPKK